MSADSEQQPQAQQPQAQQQQPQQQQPTPSSSTSSSPAPAVNGRRNGVKSGSLSLDLSDVPPLTVPTRPSNTLIFTNLQSPDVFRPDNLQTIRDLVEQTAAVRSWAPLKSFRRIVVAFSSDDDAVAVRAVWDGEAILGERVRVYFGEHTPLEPADAQQQYLPLPDAGKLFFISPPPSPPHDWEMRLEGAPNKQVHAEDLAEALARLHGRRPPAGSFVESPVSASPIDGMPQLPHSHHQQGSETRSRSSTLIYQPEDHGSNPDLPAIAVEDLTGEPDDYSAASLVRGIVTPTMRPPVELMEGV